MSRALRKPAKPSTDFGSGASTVISSNPSAASQTSSTVDAAGTQKTPEEIKKEALAFADNLYKTVVVSPAFYGLSSEAKVELFTKNYPNFMRAYPLVVNYMIHRLQYNSKAMEMFLEKLLKDANSKPAQPRDVTKAPKKSKGLTNFEERYLIQAVYVKYLYIEECKRMNKHWDMKSANEIRNNEEKMLREHMERLKKQEEDAKNSFEDEAEQHKEKRKQDLVSFIMRQREAGTSIELPVFEISDNTNTTSAVLDEECIRMRNELLGIVEETVTPAQSVDTALDNIVIQSGDLSNDTPNDIEQLRNDYRAAQLRIAELESELSCKECKLERMTDYYEKVIKEELHRRKNAWLIGTAADKTHIDKQKSNSKAMKATKVK